jgi:uncharacterized membrane protein required for colicin V production
MLSDIFRHFNWLDILVIIILLRTVYIAFKNGLSAEFFKLFGIILAIYLSLHYYTVFSDWMGRHLPKMKAKLPLDFMDFFAFALLVFPSYFISVLLRGGIFRLIRIEALPKLNKWGGLFFGICRGVLLVGLVVFILVISSIDYLKASVNSSYLAKRFLRVAPDTYGWLWKKITSKFMTKEKFNETIFEVQEGLTQK